MWRQYKAISVLITFNLLDVSYSLWNKNDNDDII